MLHPFWVGRRHFERATRFGQAVRVLFWTSYALLFHHIFADYPSIRFWAASIPLSLIGLYLTVTLVVSPLIGIHTPRNAFSSFPGPRYSIRYWRWYILQCAQGSAWLLLMLPIYVLHPIMPIVYFFLKPAVVIAFWLLNYWVAFVEVWEWNIAIVVEENDDLLLPLMFPVSFLFSRE